MKIVIWDDKLGCNVEIGNERYFYIVLENGDKFDISVNGNHHNEFMVSGDFSLKIRPKASNTVIISGE